MEEALGADGHGFLEQHDALIGLVAEKLQGGEAPGRRHVEMLPAARGYDKAVCLGFAVWPHRFPRFMLPRDRKSTRLNSSHVEISYAVFCLKKKKQRNT